MAPSANQIPRDVFSREFQESPAFEAILAESNKSPYLASMLGEMHARGSQIKLVAGNMAYAPSTGDIVVGQDMIPYVNDHGEFLYPGAGQRFVTLLAHEAGHATVQNRSLEPKTPWQAREIGLNGEGVAFRSEYIVARQLEHASGNKVTMWNTEPDAFVRDKLDELTRSNGVDQLILSRTKKDQGAAWNAFDRQTQKLGAEYFEPRFPSTRRNGIQYGENYEEHWALGRAASVIPIKQIDYNWLAPDNVRVVRNPDNSWRLIGQGVLLKDGRVMDFDVRFNANSVMQGKPRIDMHSMDGRNTLLAPHAYVEHDTVMAAPSAAVLLPEPQTVPELRGSMDRIRQNLQPQLHAHFNAEQIESLSAAAAVHTVRHAHLGPVGAMLLSRDRQTLAFKHEPMQLSEMSVPAALEKSAAEHLQQTSRDQTTARDASAPQLGAPATPATPAAPTPRAM